MDHDEISIQMIETSRYQEFKDFALAPAEPTATKKLSKFPSDLTPLILAAQHNQFSVVKKLLDYGEKINVPHHAYCVCEKCVSTLAASDELAVAKTRLFTYRGLASEAYISLTSTDPILQAFQLRQTLRKNANIEKYFKVDKN